MCVCVCVCVEPDVIEQSILRSSVRGTNGSRPLLDGQDFRNSDSELLIWQHTVTFPVWSPVCFGPQVKSEIVYRRNLENARYNCFGKFELPLLSTWLTEFYG